MRKVTKNIYNHKTEVQRPKLPPAEQSEKTEVKPPKETGKVDDGNEAADDTKTATSAKTLKSASSATSSKQSSAKSVKIEPKPTKQKPAASTASSKDAKQTGKGDKKKESNTKTAKAEAEPAKQKSASKEADAKEEKTVEKQPKAAPDGNKGGAADSSKPEVESLNLPANDSNETEATFPVVSRPTTRDSKTPGSTTSSRASKSVMSTPGSRPTTQGGSRLLFSREPTITEESEEERRHLYSAIDGKTPRLKSRGNLETRENRRNFPIRSLAGLTEEERSRRAMECSMCGCAFTEPKVFCCTRLCKKCLQSHIDISALDNEVNCLVCRNVVQVPDKSEPKSTWSEQFRTDTFLKRLQEVTEQVSMSHDCYVCESSKNKKTASTTYCFDCDTYFCDSCNVMHLQLRGLTSHCTATLDTLHIRDIMSRRRIFCESHKDRYVERFCRDCNALLCQECVDENHKKCNVIPTQQIASDKRRVLEGLKEDFDIAIRRAEEEDDMLRDRGSRMQMRVSQRKEEIEAAFNRIEKAVAERKKKLLAELTDDSLQDGLGNQSKIGQLQALVGALKDNGALAEEMVACASERDLIESGDDLVRQCMTLSEVTHNTARFAYDRPMSMARVDKYSVNTFLTLLNALGEDINEQVVAFKTRQIGLRMPEDKENPAIKDILLMDHNILLAVDNGNKCLKAIAPREGGGHKYIRLDLKTRPWGLTCMQPNVVAVTGHQCLYVITVNEDALSLQTTVRTRKDYWSIASLSPINVAGVCKFPPSIDIVDITGRRLRTIEGEVNGSFIFKQPNFLASMNGNILVTDRQEQTLVCLDQAGEIKYVYKSTTKDEAAPHTFRGVCTDSHNRAYLVDGPHVFMISEGKQQCQLLTNLPDPRAITVSKDNNVMAVSMDGRGVTFFTLSELKGPYN